MVLYHNITTIFRTSVSAYHVRVVRCCIIQLRMQVPFLGRGRMISIMEVLVICGSQQTQCERDRTPRSRARGSPGHCTLARKRAAPSNALVYTQPLRPHNVR